MSTHIVSDIMNYFPWNKKKCFIENMNNLLNILNNNTVGDWFALYKYLKYKVG